MELMTNKEFFPPMVAWGAMPKVVGWRTTVPWTAVLDIGAAITNVFEAPEQWIGRDINLISDKQNLQDCRDLFKSSHGKKPLGIPIPLALFRRMVGPEFEVMWRWMIDWLTECDLDEMIDTSRLACRDLHSVESWLKTNRNGQNGNGVGE